MKGSIVAVLRGPDGKVKDQQNIKNLITQVGDQVYAERGSGAGTPNAPTGMRLGTGSTAAAKTGAGAAIVTYIAGSAKEFDSVPGSSLNGSARRITYVTTWGPGEATDSAIAEVVITNETGPTDVAGDASNTISRALFASPIDKQASDTLEVTWHHDAEGE